MATVTVKSTSGGDYTTIATAFNNVDPGDIINIIDEATYSENNITISDNNITLQHTASELGRPKIDSSASDHAFIARGKTGLTFKGLEIIGNDNNNGNTTVFDINIASNELDGLEINDCFIYAFSGMFDSDAQGGSSTPIKFKQSSLMFCAGTRESLMFAQNSHVEVENCFLSRSHGGGAYSILRARSGSPNATASFSTFVLNYPDAAGTSGHFAIETWGKVINCVVSGNASATGLKCIDAIDHTFNVVNTTGTPFLDGASSADSAAASETTDAVTFVDGSSTGRTESVVQNFALVAGSVGIDQGTSFNSIAVDINNTARPQNGSFDMGAFELFVSSDPFTDADGNETFTLKYGSNSFELRTTANRLITRRFATTSANRQAPYSTTIRGPANIRGRKTAYKVEAGNEGNG